MPEGPRDVGHIISGVRVYSKFEILLPATRPQEMRNAKGNSHQHTRTVYILTSVQEGQHAWTVPYSRANSWQQGATSILCAVKVQRYNMTCVWMEGKLCTSMCACASIVSPESVRPLAPFEATKSKMKRAVASVSFVLAPAKS